MKLSTLLELVKNSAPADWLRLDRFALGWSALTAPRLGDELEFGRVAVLQENLDVSLLVSVVGNNDVFDADEVEFGHDIKETLAVQLAYRGIPVYEWVLLLLGEENLLIPMPVAIDGKLEFEKHELPYARLIAGILGVSPADRFQLQRLKLLNVLAV